MADLFNLTNITNARGWMEFAQETSKLSSNLPGMFIIIMVFVVLFIALKQKGYDAAKCFAASSWVIMILALLLYPMELISGYVFWISIITVPLSILFLFLGSKE